MADRFLVDLLKRHSEGDGKAKGTLKEIRRTLDSLDISPKKKPRVEHAASSSNNHIAEEFECEQCGKKYSSGKSYRAHIKSHMEQFPCGKCQYVAKRKYDLKRHELAKHNISNEESSKWSCEYCKITFGRKDSLTKHVKHFHVNHCVESRAEASGNQSPIQSPPDTTLEYNPEQEGEHEVNSPDTPTNTPSGNNPEQESGNAVNSPQNIAVDNNIREAGSSHQFSDESSLNGAANVRYIYPNDEENGDLLTFFTNVKQEVTKHLQQRCEELSGIKYYVCVQVQLEKEDRDGNVQQSFPHFRSKNYIFLPSELFDEDDLNGAFQKMFSSFESFIREGSNWVLKKILKLEVSTVNYSPLSGSSYISTPNTFSHHSIINVWNKDEKCFLWSVLASIHPVSNFPERVSHYVEYEHELDMSGISYPVSLAQVKRFEKQNNISINVFGYEDKTIFPMYVTKIRQALHHVNLLFLQQNDKTHYCVITNLNQFLSRTKTTTRESHFCHYCLQGFTRKVLMDKHIEHCSKNDPQHVELPKENMNGLEFKDFDKQLKIPFVIYADFETFAQKMDTCQPNPQKSSTTVSTKFEPCGFGYQVVCINDKYTKAPVVYRGSDVSKKFLQNLVEEEKIIKEILKNVEPMIMTEDDKLKFQSSTKCHICNNVFTKDDPRVRDHCHLTGKYRGAAHNSCNINYKYPNFIPVVFHNLKGFDGHILCESLGLFKDHEIKCLPNNMEKYISFSLGNLRFIDSFAFMSQSLEKLTENLAKEGLAKFYNFSKEFSRRQAELLLRKGVYPYEYVDAVDKFLEKQLPPREQFYSQLSKSHISTEDYEHAQKVWEEMNIQNLGQYHDLYLKTDVLLLADVFENFRTMCLNYYGLDSIHFYTAPGLSWSSALKMSGVHLELLTDPNMYLFFEQGVRGGVSTVTNKYGRANNPLIPETYDPSKPNSYVMYTDANNLYGKAMSEPLPVGSFKWIDDVINFDVTDIPKDGDLGYVLEVDLEYPEHLHDMHSDYPLAPERKKVSDDELSPHSKILWKKLNPSPKHTDQKLHGRVKTEKLVPTLEYKTKYIVHYRNLQLYLELGMKLTHIHRILEFRQHPWLKKYIDFNSQKRQEAKNDFEKDFFKLLNNSVFGRTLMNVRKRVDIKLAHTEKKLKKYCARPSFQRFKIFNEDLTGIENSKVKLLLNQPVYAGQAILDLSKCIMYEFYYKYLKPKYGNGIKLLFTDTDSFCYDVQCDDIYDDMYRDRHLFDLSNYPVDHPCRDCSNKKVPGYFSDETSSNPIAEFMGLRAKMYSFSYAVREKTVIENCTIISNTIKEKQVAKGVAKATIKRDLHHEMYRECLFGEKSKMCEMSSIRSDGHQLGVYSTIKSALSPFDDKRYVLENGCDTLAFGHYRIHNSV